MNDWIAVSEIVRNIALAIAGFVGAYLAWRQLSPAAVQARSANAQADLARRTHVIELFNRAAANSATPSSRLDWRRSMFFVESRRTFPILLTLFLN